MKLKRAISSVLSAKSENDKAVSLKRDALTQTPYSRLMPRKLMKEEGMRCLTEMPVIIQEIWIARTVLPGMLPCDRRLNVMGGIRGKNRFQ